jgi:hypothetical protein
LKANPGISAQCEYMIYIHFGVVVLEALITRPNISSSTSTSQVPHTFYSLLVVSKAAMKILV